MRHVELSNLHHTDLNVRSDPKATADIDDLKASICAHGLLQPLVAVKNGSGYMVVAGGRRLAALKALAKENIGYEDATKIPVTVISEEDARSASLSENLIRRNLTPLEIWEAIAGLDLTQKEIAARFSMPIDNVRKAQRLGRLHPAVLRAYKVGDMSDTEAQAYAATADTDEQLRVFEEMKDYSGWSPYSEIKAKLGFATQWDTQRMLRDAGEAYKAAGGKVEKDLFGEDVRVLDPDLLAKVYAQHIRQEDETLAAEAGCPVAPEEPGEGWRRTYPDERASEEDEARIKEIFETLREDRDELTDEAYEALNEECETLYAKRKPIAEEGTVVYHGGFYEPYIHENDLEPADEEIDTGPDDILTAKARTALGVMRHTLRREALGAGSKNPNDAAMKLAFVVIRSIYGRLAGTTLYTAAGNLSADPAWLSEKDELAAFAMFRKDPERHQIMAEVTANMFTRDCVGTQTIADHWTEQDHAQWQSTEAFWEMFRKKEALLTLADEFAPTIREQFTGRKISDLRSILHRLCSGETVLGIPAEEHGGAQSWTPSWLRFETEDEEAMEEAA